MTALRLLDQSWWHFEGWPTAAEWQSVWAGVGAIATVGALIYALFQLKGIRDSNAIAATAARESARANELAAKAAIESVRPYVQFELIFEQGVVGNPKEQSGEGVAFLRLRNNGRTPARKLSLVADPPFETSGEGSVHTSGIDPVKKAFDVLFSGKYEIPMLAPGQEIKYFLDYATQLLDDESDLPKRYIVDATYFGDDLNTEFTDQFVLDPTMQGLSVAEVDPVLVIARQFRRWNEKSELNQRRRSSGK